MKTLFRTIFLLLFLGFAVTAPAQNSAELELIPISGSSQEVRIKAVMTPTFTTMNVEAVSVAVAYDPALFTVNANTSITNMHFQQYNWEDASVPTWDDNGVDPDVIVYGEYHPSFGSQAIFRGVPPTLCEFVFYPKSNNPGTADFTVYANNPTAALTYYFEYNVTGQKNFTPVTNITGMPFPVELSLFTAAQQGQSIALRWVTQRELNNHGFHVQRHDHGSATGDWHTIGFVDGAGSTNSERQYVFFDWNLPADGTYSYRLKQVDFDGSATYSDPVLVHYVDSPLQFALRQNYPNPVSTSSGGGTTVSYDIAERSRVRLTVSNLLGQEIAVLAEHMLDAGSYSAQWRPTDVTTGTYIIALTAEAVESGRTELFHQRVQLIR